MQCARIASISVGTNFNKYIFMSSSGGGGLLEPQIASFINRKWEIYPPQ